MSNIVHSSEELVGGTPLLELCRMEKKLGLCAHVYAKLEYRNPSGSAKDRAALWMLNDAEKRGILKPGGTVIEPTSGNTGIGLCAIGVGRGYRVIIVMPDTMSLERQKLMLAYGGELILTPGAKGMAGAIEEAERLRNEIPGSIIAGQFENPANARAHYESTGPEIYSATDGQVDMFVAGVGTGGTLTGTGRYLKEKKPSVRVIAVEPARSPLLTGGSAGAHGLQGIGANFIPSLLDRTVYDSVADVREEDAYRTARMLGKTEGILCGISSGAALFAALTEAAKKENAGRHIVVLLPDSGERYLSTDLYGEN